LPGSWQQEYPEGAGARMVRSFLWIGHFMAGLLIGIIVALIAIVGIPSAMCLFVLGRNAYHK
jgi:hypothetical protein